MALYSLSDRVFRFRDHTSLFLGETIKDQERKKTIQEAIESAKKEAETEVKVLKQNAEEQRKELSQKTAEKIPASINTVIDFIKG